MSESGLFFFNSTSFVEVSDAEIIVSHTQGKQKQKEFIDYLYAYCALHAKHLICVVFSFLPGAGGEGFSSPYFRDIF